VIGKEVPIRLLEPVTNLSNQAVRQSLGRLEGGEFLYERSIFPTPVYTFKHTLTSEVAYGSLVGEQRRTFDARVLEALERLDPNDSAVHVERLAHHAFRGEVWEKAVRYCREAGAQAFSRSAHRAALDYFEQALSALAHLPSTAETVGQAIDLRLDMRYALMPLGDFPRLFDCLTTAQELARSAGDQRRLGLISAFLTNYFLLMGDPEQAVEHGRRALDLSRPGQDLDVITVANTYLAGAYYVLGQYAAAIATARENVSRLTGPLLTERFGVAALPSVYSRTWLAWSLAELGKFTEAARVAEDGLAVAESTAHSFSLIYACLGVGTVALRRGQADEAVEALARAFRLCQEAEVPLLFATVAIPLTSAYVLAGRGADALRVVDEAGARAASINDPVGGRAASGAMAEAYLATGRAADALPLARRYVEQRRALKARGLEAWALRLLGDVARQQSPPQLDEAAARYEEAQAIADRLGMKPLSALCRLRLGSLYRRLGRSDASRTSLEAARELLVSLHMTFWLRELEDELRAAP
jgi:tetratricopeptide (TPR) repeat protein